MVVTSYLIGNKLMYIKIKTMRPIFEEKTNTTSLLGPFCLIESYL